jgi:NhaA family Na+:H+ antiporter
MADAHDPQDFGPPPGTWLPLHRTAQGLRRPVERFLAIEAASGILLLVAAAVALAWANSPWSASYSALWHTPIGIRIGGLAFERDLAWWINDGLMVIFFFVVGLEIRREIHQGELSDLRRAALPLMAALGGMLVPALIYVGFNAGRPTLDGWGIPMATDIAFAVGVLTLLGPRVAPALRILLLALAVIDDVGAILVIALFYSSGIEAAGMGVMGGGVLGVLVLQWLGVRSPWAYVMPVVVVWGGAYAGGIHPTLAGVLAGLLTPVKAWLGVPGFVSVAEQHLTSLRRGVIDHHTLLDLDGLERARAEAVAPVVRLQHALHGWVAFGIMPLFALANAGVPLGSASFAGDGLAVFAGVGLGLVLGKVLGIFVFSWLAVRLGLAALPTGVGWLGVGIVGLVGGIGFTMALFVASLALPPGAMLETAKLAILCGSFAAVIVALVVGRVALPARVASGAARDAHEAERSTVA